MGEAPMPRIANVSASPAPPTTWRAAGSIESYHPIDQVIADAGLIEEVSTGI